MMLLALCNQKLSDEKNGFFWGRGKHYLGHLLTDFGASIANIKCLSVLSVLQTVGHSWN